MLGFRQARLIRESLCERLTPRSSKWTWELASHQYCFPSWWDIMHEVPPSQIGRTQPSVGNSMVHRPSPEPKMMSQSSCRWHSIPQLGQNAGPPNGKLTFPVGSFSTHTACGPEPPASLHW